MDIDTGYELLWQMNQKEKQTNELLLLPRTFYEDTKEFVKSLEKPSATEDETNMRKNALRLLEELKERRRQKIIIYVAYKKSLPQPTITEEEALYGRIVAAINNDTTKQGKQERDEGALKMLQPIPEIILPSGKKVGPFDKGQMVEIENRSDADFLINNMICQKA
jgi:DNA replication initiation complex subunit (GINS family)